MVGSRSYEGAGWGSWWGPQSAYQHISTATRAARSKGDAQAKGGGAAVLGGAGAAAPILKIALHAYCRRLRRVERRHLRRRQRQLPTHAPRVKPWACLPRRGSRQVVLGGAGHLVVSRDQVSKQLRYHPNDFLGRANAHHLMLRHRGWLLALETPSEPPVPAKV